jgi:hypothetical protein
MMVLASMPLPCSARQAGSVVRTAPVTMSCSWALWVLFAHQERLCITLVRIAATSTMTETGTPLHTKASDAWVIISLSARPVQLTAAA